MPDVPAPLNQGNTVACTQYALCAVGSTVNSIEHGREIQFDPLIPWQIMVNNGLTTKKGATLQNALKTILENGFGVS